jgi:hypothetical protein
MNPLRLTIALLLPMLTYLCAAQTNTPVPVTGLVSSPVNTTGLALSGSATGCTGSGNSWVYKAVALDATGGSAPFPTGGSITITRS